MDDDTLTTGWRALMEMCRASGGVFTTSQAAGLGLDARRLSRSVAKGTLVRESRGIYRLAAYPLGQPQRLAVALAMGVVISHESAAQLWGYELDSLTHVTAPRGSRPTGPQWMTVHVARRTLKGETAIRSGVPVTLPPRTILDLAGSALSDDLYRAFVSHCIAARLVGLGALDRYVSRHRYVPGLGRLRLLLNEMGEVDSTAEAELVDLLVAAGVDRPVTQFPVRDAGRFIARVDLAWPTQRVALELDGYRYHSDPQSFVSDRERGNRIVLLGWTLLRTTPSTVRRYPDRLVADVRTALHATSVA